MNKKDQLLAAALNNAAHLNKQVLGDNETVVMIDVEKILPNPFQPRKHFDPDKLNELAASIEANGMIEPIIVVDRGDNYILSVGERRLRATKMIAGAQIKAIVRTATDDQLRIHAMIENTHRDDLSLMEQANGYKEIKAALGNIDDKELARVAGVSYSHLRSILSLTKLPEIISDDLIARKSSMSLQVLERLSSLPQSTIKVIYDEILKSHMNRKEALLYIEQQKEKGPEKKQEKKQETGKANAWGSFKKTSTHTIFQLNRKIVSQENLKKIDKLFEEIISLTK